MTSPPTKTSNPVSNSMGLSASASDPDSFTFEQAMASPDREEWMKAAAKEIASLESKNTWDEVNI